MARLTWIPSFDSSAWIFRARQGFSLAIWMIRSFVSPEIGGRPGPGANEDQKALPSRPEAREGDPEGAIQRGETRPWVSMGVDRELLAEGQLDHGLVLTTPKEGDGAAKDRDPEGDQRPHLGERFWPRSEWKGSLNLTGCCVYPLETSAKAAEGNMSRINEDEY